MNRIYSFNKAEGVFFPAFDTYICEDSQLSVSEGKIVRTWDSLSVQGGRYFTVRWQGETEIAGYDRLVCFISAAPHARCTGSAVVNGNKIMLFTDAAGDEFPSEWSGKLPEMENGILTEVVLDFTFEADHNTVSVSWLGLANDVLLEELEEQTPVWEETWCQEIHFPATAYIEKNLFFTPEEGEALKAQMRNDPNVLAQLKENAENAMRIRAEDQVRAYAPTTNNMYRFVRVRDRGREPMEGMIRNLAVAGFVLDEPAYSIQAAKLILALIHMKWYEGPICEMEGSRFHHVCFTEDHMLTEVTLSLGFMGGIFTEKAQGWIVDKIEEAWKFVCSKCAEPGYRNYMNQGIVGQRAVMLGAAFLQSWKGGYEQAIEDAYKRHTALVGNYLTGDGHCAEGANYYEYSFAGSVLLWHVYARQVNREVAEIVPERFKRSGRYLEAIMSAGHREGVKIPLNCGALQHASMLLVTFMTAVCDFPEGNNYLIARFADGEKKKAESNFDLMFYEYYKSQIVPHPYYRQEEEEISFPEAGLLTYRRGNTKLLVTAERNPLTGHCHDDRGGIVLEADGEILLPELGTTNYTNPSCLLMHKKEYHNLACPADIEMTAESEAGRNAAAMAAYPITEELTPDDMVIPEAKVLYAGKRGDAYCFAVETGMLFGENISGMREGIFRENTISLDDTWVFPEAHPVIVTYMSYQPWEIDCENAKAVSGRMSIRVSSENRWKFTTEEGAVDYNNRPVYIMRVVSEEAENHTIHSEICLSPLKPSPQNSGRENTIAFQKLLDQGGTIRIEEPGVYEIEDTLYISSHTRLIFGPGVYLKRSASSIGSFAMINRGAFTRTYDEDILIEGLHLITNGVEARYHAAVYGLTGELSFFYVKNLRMIDFTCMDLPKLSFGIHVCTFEDLVIDRIHVEGRKDAVHLGTGSKFVIRHGLFRTFDDPIALNAHDYAVANPQMGWIEDGLIEDCYDLADEDTTGFFCRILAGAWVDWYRGMEIRNSDTVVHNGRVYRAFQKPDGTKYCSMTPPTHTEGMETHEGIHWVMVQENVTYQCGCRNIHFKDIHLQKEREKALSIHFDHDQYSRSVYPGAEMPVQENLIFENLIIQNKVDCVVRSITPVDTIKIINSVMGDSNILLEALPEEDVVYPKTKVLLLGNTLTADGDTPLIQCLDKCSCEVKALGNLVMGKDFRAVTEGEVEVVTEDFPVIRQTG